VAAYEALLEELDDMELSAIISERQDDTEVSVDMDDL
jgi:hypothetical protein|tara:strand:+ start:1044 stop:1154 length:111 start_codon:yes stop_codon:yes gene_type:complete